MGAASVVAWLDCPVFVWLPLYRCGNDMRMTVSTKNRSPSNITAIGELGKEVGALFNVDVSLMVGAHSSRTPAIYELCASYGRLRVCLGMVYRR